MRLRPRRPAPVRPGQGGDAGPDLRGRRALVAEGALSRLSFGIVGFAMPLYATELGLSLPAVGAVMALNTAVALALKPLAGTLADRFGPRRSLLTAMLLRSVLSALYALAAAPWQLFAVRGLHGVADSARDPAVAVLVSDAGGRQAVARSFAWYQTAKTSAGAAGKAFAGLLITLTGARYGLVFGVAALLSLLPVLVVARWVREPVPGPPDGGAPGATAAGHVVAAPDVVAAQAAADAGGADADGAAAAPRRLTPYVVLGVLVSSSASSLTALFPLLATEYAGLSAAQAGALYLLTPVLAFTGPGFGWLADRWTRRGVLAFRGVANLVSSALYLLAPGFPGFLAGKALDDVGKAAFKPAWGSVMSDVARLRPHRRARAMALLTVGEDAGDVLAPLVAALVWHWWGVVPLLLGRALLSLAAEAQGWYVERSGGGTAPGVARRTHRTGCPRRRAAAAPGAAVPTRLGKARAGAPVDR